MSSNNNSTSRWSFHRHVYDWALNAAKQKYATTALFLLSFAESCIIPITPNILLVPMILQRRNRVWYYTLITIIASVLGGIVGYLIGILFWDLTSGFFLNHVFSIDSILPRVNN